MNPATANTLGIICAAFICTLAVTVMIQPEPKPDKQDELTALVVQVNREADEYHARHDTKPVILLPVIKSSPVDKSKLADPKNGKEWAMYVDEAWSGNDIRPVDFNRFWRK